MAKKTRPFSIYLLKAGWSATSALRAGHSLEEEQVDGLPAGSSLFVLDTQAKEPWWKGYFGIQRPLGQTFKGALVFLPVGGRTFALAFGPVFHHLKDEAYEYDFGLRVTLNSLDPTELKSTDVVEPGAARRRRTQVPVSTELTYLDFDANSDIIKSLTGTVKQQYRELFRNATGSSSLKVGLKLEPNEIAATCETLFTLYNSEEYKTSFPNIENISSVRDPSTVRELDGELVVQFNLRTTAGLSVPEIIDFKDNTCCIFSGDGHVSDIHPDITIEALYEFLDDNNITITTAADLKNLRMSLTDADGNVSGSFNIYRSLICDVNRPHEDVIYHLTDGSWYKVNENYLQRVTAYLDSKWEVRAWFDSLVSQLLHRYGRLYIIQPHRQQERCARRCWEAKGDDCECQCMGEHHGKDRPGGRWFEVADMLAVSWGERSLAYRLLVRR